VETQVLWQLSIINNSFQKDLIVWKLRGCPERETVFGFVSEGLNSVETHYPNFQQRITAKFQKNLIVWKPLYLCAPQQYRPRFRRT